MFSLEKRGMFEDSREQLAARVGGNSKTIKTKSQTQGTKALLLNALFDTCDRKLSASLHASILTIKTIKTQHQKDGKGQFT